MPLPPPDCTREAAHQRSITINAYARSDGLWDIEGHLTDAWTKPVPRAGGYARPARRVPLAARTAPQALRAVAMNSG